MTLVIFNEYNFSRGNEIYHHFDMGGGEKNKNNMNDPFCVTQDHFQSLLKSMNKDQFPRRT